MPQRNRWTWSRIGLPGLRALTLLAVVTAALTPACRPGPESGGRPASEPGPAAAPAAVQFGEARSQVEGMGEPRPEPEHVLAAGEKMPPLVLPDLAGADHELAAYAGKAVVLNVWASWCAPCVRELPSLQRLHESAGENLAVVTISVDEQDFTTRHMIERVGLTAPVWLDPGGKQVAAWGTVKYPETWILDREGRVVERVLGARDWASEETMAILRAL